MLVVEGQCEGKVPGTIVRCLLLQNDIMSLIGQLG
jgi:hypothetical protein